MSSRPAHVQNARDRKSTRLNSSHSQISYAVFCLKKKKTQEAGIKVPQKTSPSAFPRLQGGQACFGMLIFFFFNDTATTEIYTLSLHDALPISRTSRTPPPRCVQRCCRPDSERPRRSAARSEEHTSELQSQSNLVCRLLLE